MAYSFGNKYTKNCCKRTILVQLILKEVVTCFLEHSVHFLANPAKNCVNNFSVFVRHLSYYCLIPLLYRYYYTLSHARVCFPWLFVTKISKKLTHLITHRTASSVIASSAAGRLESWDCSPEKTDLTWVNSDIEGVSKSISPETFWNIFILVKSFCVCMKFCKLLTVHIHIGLYLPIFVDLS